MKRSFSIKLLILCGVVLLCFSCKEQRCGEIKKPKNLKAIDWENYNDVHTVYWNYFGYCSDREANTEDIVSVYGWCYCDDDNLYLIDVTNPNKPQKNCYDPMGSNADIIVNISKLSTTDDYFAKTVYVKGVVQLPCLYEMGCSTVAVEIVVTNPDDIYFE